MAAQAASVETGAAMAQNPGQERAAWMTAVDYRLFKKFWQGLKHERHYIIMAWFMDMNEDAKIRVLKKYEQTPEEDRMNHRSKFWANFYNEFLGLRERSRSPRR